MAIALAGGILAFRGRNLTGEVLLVCGLVLAIPTLWVTALSMLIAIVPLRRTAGRLYPESASTMAQLSEVTAT